METQGARRAAERIAKDLIKSRAVLIGELGVRQAEQADRRAAVDAVEAEARQLIERAEAEGARLVADAQQQARSSADQYAAAYSAAVEGGWAPADLAAMGFPSGRRRGAPRGSVPAADATAQPIADGRQSTDSRPS